MNWRSTLALDLAEIGEEATDQVLLKRHDAPTTAQAQDMGHGVADLLSEAPPVRPGLGQRSEIGADLGGLAGIGVPADEGDAKLPFPTLGQLTGLGHERELLPHRGNVAVFDLRARVRGMVTIISSSFAGERRAFG